MNFTGSGGRLYCQTSPHACWGHPDTILRSYTGCQGARLSSEDPGSNLVSEDFSMCTLLAVVGLVGTQGRSEKTLDESQEFHSNTSSQESYSHTSSPNVSLQSDKSGCKRDNPFLSILHHALRILISTRWSLSLSPLLLPLPTHVGPTLIPFGELSRGVGRTTVKPKHAVSNIVSEDFSVCAILT
jgi:hypothetical protein